MKSIAWQTLSRRDFLRLSSTAATGTLLASYIRLTAATSGVITLYGGDADVWAWEKTVSGEALEVDCDTLTVQAGENAIEIPLAGEQFRVTVPIAAGENVIRTSCEEMGVTSEPLVYTGKLRRTPMSNIIISLDGSRIVLDGSESQSAEKDGTPITSYQWTARASNPSALTIEEQTERIEFDVPSVGGEYYVSLQVTDGEGLRDTSTTYFTVTNGQPVLANWDTENAAWIEDAVVYGVIPRNFGSEGFQSIIDRLDYLKDLGINALWLAPINQSPPGDYGYAVVDYFDVDGRYGELEDFRRMVQEAHARDIRVLMDFVPNHSSEKHPYFLDTLRHGMNSPYWTYYDRDESGLFTHYFDWTHLPNLNYENPEVRRWMLEAFTYWVREFDVDGFRVDVAWGIRERRPNFWPEWRRALKRIKPDALLLAEASARDEFYFTDGFDAAYDWTGQLGHWAWERVWEDENLLTFNLNSALTNMRNGFHGDALIFRFLNNNDTGPRFITSHGLEMTRVAAALLLTLPGIPCIFTGDEVGEAFQPYFDPSPLTWEDTHGLLDYYKKLIALRHEVPSLHSRHWTILEVEPHVQVYSYLRHLADGSEPVLVLLNFSDQAVGVTLPTPISEIAAFEDLLSGEAVSTPVTMLPLTAMILRES